MTGTEHPGQVDDGWDEAQCTSALAHLERLQAQIDDLRLAIPQIVEPFHQPFTSTTFKQYAQGAMSSQNGIKSLNEQWNSLENQKTFEHVRKSYATNSDLSASTTIPSYGWQERARSNTDPVQNVHSDVIEENCAVLSDKDVSRIIVEFQKKRPDIKLETQDDDQTILMYFISTSKKLEFRIVIERDANGRHKLAADCLGPKELLQAITRCIASRPNANDLEYLLDMLAAYKTMKPPSCAKCAKILDQTMLPPTARRSFP
ncbi:hypothetical protein LEMA_P074220.1 [Plenodomus lingam JN3]|uniref:Uncharacterized protein n=1 Tax=Leptosphaeria maculans (strain JN3 / isolate v23.1.3 / race Av1-4-5-6-7-8) TaxID=985895 RepID=E5A888_LEPMJ|nr:hypothetical protein LEMA_P074220.1 [Plenodomus lingam JN3]CBX99833.1 hypothetical protein LEMA_P074220.1 [Plenodomus lingam JN3]